jgi:hypothetical protein
MMLIMSPGNVQENDVMRRHSGQCIIIFGATHDQLGYAPYTILEKFKNGVVVSGKYTGKEWYCGNNVMKVIVMANAMPQMDKVSEDRWVVATISKSLLSRIIICKSQV